MKKTAAAASALAVGAFATAAKADEGAATHDWTGFFLGAGAGFVGAEADWQIDGGEGFFADEDGPAETSDDLGAFAAQAGYNQQIGKIVVGGIADYSLTDVEDTARFDGGEGAELRSRIKHVGTFRARVGYAMDRVLLFASGGVALTDQRHTYDSDGSPSTAHSSRMVGWVTGGGVELAVDENVSLLLEGMFASFSGEAVASGPFYDDKFDVDTDLVLARLGVNFRF